MSDQNMNNNTGNAEVVYNQADIDKNKTIAGLAYIIFFLPLIVCPESAFGKFHANQSLMLFITSIAGCIVLSIIPIIGWLLLPFFCIGIFVFAIIGLIGGLAGKAKDLPIIGKIRLLK